MKKSLIFSFIFVSATLKAELTSSALMVDLNQLVDNLTQSIDRTNKLLDQTMIFKMFSSCSKANDLENAYVDYGKNTDIQVKCNDVKAPFQVMQNSISFLKFLIFGTNKQPSLLFSALKPLSLIGLKQDINQILKDIEPIKQKFNCANNTLNYIMRRLVVVSQGEES